MPGVSIVDDAAGIEEEEEDDAEKMRGEEVPDGSGVIANGKAREHTDGRAVTKEKCAFMKLVLAC